MSDASLQRDIGKLEAQVASLGNALAHLTNKIDTLDSKIDEMDKMLSEAKGGWKMLVILSSVSAAIGGLIVKFLPYILNR